MVLVPILNLTEHEVSGGRRWTGRAYLPGRLNRTVLILDLGDRLIAVRQTCPHWTEVSLLPGRLDLDDNFLECPGHGWQMQLDGPELLAKPVVRQDGAFFLEID